MRELLRLNGLLACLVILVASTSVSAGCKAPAGVDKQLLWGDLHVHTSHSLDAYAFGSLATPAEAYAYARGQPLRLDNGQISKLDRPLDFAAVTDHAATFDQMYICTDPLYQDNDYCNHMRKARSERNGRSLFYDYLLPVVGAVEPEPPAFCSEDGVDCPSARKAQWRRAQFAANQANEPCQFTALIGYEWTASPGGLHWHRNVIYRSDQVPDDVFDYVRFPKVTQLWQQLERHCQPGGKPGEGCNVLTIPHNINWADGGPTFAVEQEAPGLQALRHRYERLAEMHQEKGNSECLPASPLDQTDDCGFERLLENSARSHLSGENDSQAAAAWAKLRSSYYRSLLGRGLLAYQQGTSGINPLMLGAMASTDTHFGTAGRVAEEGYLRISGMYLDEDAQLKDSSFNPGGLVAVWAEENTREAIFDALHRREAYGTSGPRISVRFGSGPGNYCEDRSAQLTTTMGGTLPADTTSPTFIIQAAKDQQGIGRVEIVRGVVINDELTEEVIEVGNYPKGRATTCVAWQDNTFNPDRPAYWYARVVELPTPRWSKLLCERAGKCEAYPEADRLVEERAWSSPVWALP